MEIYYVDLGEIGEVLYYYQKEESQTSSHHSHIIKWKKNAGVQRSCGHLRLWD